jgi:hypothetical protein
LTPGNVSMTLAVIMLNALCAVSPPLAAGAHFSEAAKAAPAAAIEAQASTQSQGAQSDSSSQTPSAQSTPSQPSQSQSTTNSSSQKHPATSKAAHKPNQKPKAETTNCNPAPSKGTAAGTNAKSVPDSKQSTSSGTGKAAANTGNTVKTSAPSNCPPNKIVVQQGSAPEPSIQLAGDAAGSNLRQTNECGDTSHCLQTADDNLKKIAGRGLSSDQKDIVTQVKQFIDQSKDATKNGDLDSARTLAWKAQSLSEELVNPEK